MERLRLAIGWTVLVLWGASMIFDVIPSIEYNAPAALHAVMMVVVGSFFGPTIMRRAQGKENGHD